MGRETNGDGQSDRRTWLITAREEHELTREQAEILVRKRTVEDRGRKLSCEQFERAVAERRARPGLSQPDLALLITGIGPRGCSQNEISKIEAGERQRIRPEYVEALSEIYRMSREQVQYGSPRPKVRILGEMLRDEAIRLFGDEEHFEINGFTPDADTDGYRVAVDSLEPRFRQGDILLCHRVGASLEECIGRECVAEIDGRRYVGLVERGASPRVITLRPSRSWNLTLIDRTPNWIAPILATYHARLRPSNTKSTGE